MKLTTKTEYLLLALIYIARHEKDNFIKIEDICIKYSISKKYLEQLFLTLKQNRYVKTRRGSRGGYKLTKSSSKISVAEIARLMDGALAPTESVSKYFYSHTPLEQEEKALKVLREIRDYVSSKLEKIKLSDLI
ncbi:MAG: Rrf2 family transcriptional regulator [Candidatus Omnitrophica bacterium]|nr:Rrf2 family transcriptional regulator [Candidatus Omnitrophota bacterium]